MGGICDIWTGLWLRVNVQFWRVGDGVGQVLDYGCGIARDLLRVSVVVCMLAIGWYFGCLVLGWCFLADSDCVGWCNMILVWVLLWMIGVA